VSRAFVKEDDDAPDEPLPPRPVSEQPNYVTANGLAQLQARLAELETQRVELAPRADTDDTARDRLRTVERDLRYFRVRLESALPGGPPGRDAAVVGFGATVAVRDDSGTRSRYAIVGEDEAEPEEGLVSWVSPLARVLEGGRVGERVVWRRPVGSLELLIESIRYEDD
jgi:transcription elongation GreA/GreB family factor